jgi:hypothetical protein
LNKKGKMKKLYTIGALALMFSACKPSANVTTPPTSGNVNFANYMDVGSSFSAGYADSSLTVSGQLNSYSQRLFEQFSTIKNTGAIGQFIQPLVTGDNGYPTSKLILGTLYNCDGTTSLGAKHSTLPLDSNGSWLFSSNINNGQINNISVPFIRVADYTVSGYANDNKLAARFYYAPAKRPMDELYSRVFNLHPTFFTVWLGANDVLGYALSGGQGNGTGTATPVGGKYNTTDITPFMVFADNYDSIVTAVSSTSAAGALLNIPDITALPFFNAVPSNGLTITRQGQADTLHAIYAAKGYDIVFQEGKNQFVVRDNDDKIRQSVPGELILLTIPRDSIICAGWGSVKPIPREYVLTTDELQNIRQMVDKYNSNIKQQCIRRNLAYVDMNAFMKSVSAGLAYNGIKYTTDYISGGAFSLDAIHMTPRGNALVANYVLTTINSFYRATVPLTDANKYPGVKYP